ncbi:endonuclease/exonuclease/phosphatase family protein [Elizabethkingia anophelis]|uniref:endonuclease/exonuclease/phosphatase family protein n=1 Tax=Elizabethkingia anophelis TaxID=1117645 RepID=UPI001369DBA3|nr:endonuclease/exonuclease/phosphatase family protein [Elizabethkingia anophelis]MCT4237489.1 endonuclease/exonuclease/phosphatase family protein [Elizabethkingia anophelis]MYZ61441.1 endonuclease/exonuclease/phosphatase family protein [Elizabethkingia anophelis]
MKLIYWNTRKTNNQKAILEILSENNPDIFFISEVDNSLLNNFETNADDYEIFENPGCNRVKILKRKTLSLNLSIQNNYFTTVKNNNQQFIIGVHFPSQMYQSHDALKNYLRMFRNSIESEIGDSLDHDIIIIGDFNISPFEKPMIDFDGFSATNSIFSRKKVTHLQQTKSLYYNPTWKLYNRIHFPGTMFYARPSTTSFDILEHHLLDQVVISPRLATKLKDEQVKIIEKTSSQTFLNSESLKTEISDHLPLYYEFKTN